MKILNLKQSILALALGFIAFSSQAQTAHRCGTDAVTKEFIEKHPELKMNIESLEQSLNSMDINSLPKNRAGNYIIPMVFHVIHNYGSENISEAQIKDQIRVLNEDYQKRNADTNLILSVFKPLIANVGFEFRLATIDPQGNCTNGIDRIASHRTYYGDETSKLNPWPRNRYLNIWVVASFEKAGLLAYALKPATAQFSPEGDGVIVWHRAVGSIGSAAGTTWGDETLTHEIGHCMNLDHLWGSTNDPKVKCGDDNVTDTPNTEGHDNCDLIALTTDTVCKGTSDNTAGSQGQLEMLQNYMEYSFCPNNAFTNGQKDRMINALNSSIAQRSELFTATTQTLTGTLDGQVADCNPEADFNAARRFACLGNTSGTNVNITYKDFSYKNTIIDRDWTFVDGNPAVSTSTNPVVYYNTKGWKSATLKASTNATKFGTLTLSDYVYISDPADQNSKNTNNSFEDPNDYSRWPIFNYFNNPFTWKYYDAGNVPSGWRALMFNGFDSRPYPQNATNTPFKDIDDIMTPSYDATGLATGFVSFKLASSTTAGNISQINDSLILSYSTNCGATWTTLKNLVGSALINNGSQTTPFYPSANTSWTTVSVPMTAAAANANVYFRLRHVGGLYSNNLFIDNFMVGNAPTAVEKVQEGQIGVTLVPNPATNNAAVVINSPSSENTRIVVTDLVGKVIYTNTVSPIANQSTSYQLPTQVFNTKGIYMVTVSNESSKTTQKLIIQ
jgi:hypothetical protein